MSHEQGYDLQAAKFYGGVREDKTGKLHYDDAAELAPLELPPLPAPRSAVLVYQPYTLIPAYVRDYPILDGDCDECGREMRDCEVLAHFYPLRCLVYTQCPGCGHEQLVYSLETEVP